MIKCLRALSMPLAAEHARRDDILMAAPSELLSIPVHACQEEKNPHCQCRRVFVGLETGQPTTLARVCVSDQDDVYSETDDSLKVVPYITSGSDEDGIILHGVECIANALKHFELGTLLRINRSDNKVFLEDTWKTAATTMGAAR